MNQDCVSKTKAKVMRAAVIGSIRARKVKQKDIVKMAGVTPQHIHNVLHEGKAISLRLHAVFKRALRKAWPDLAQA